jgi:hypothetical protein
MGSDKSIDRLVVGFIFNLDLTEPPHKIPDMPKIHQNNIQPK